MTATFTPRRFAVFAHFDPDGQVAPHVRRTISALTDFADRVVIVSTAPLTRDSREWLGAHAELIERSNSGHDFASYRTGMERMDERAEQLILMNDSAVFPLSSLADIFATMAVRGGEVWGISPGHGFSPHIQSYMLVFTRKVITSPAFRALWAPGADEKTRDDLIVEYEVGLATALTDAGFRLDTYFRPSLSDRIIGAARAHADELDRALQEHRWRSVAGWYRRLPHRVRRPEWNSVAVLADIALRRPDRLPAVKISALRDDAYHLGSPALLRALERDQPEHFTGVEAYLDRTDRAYGGRWKKAANSPPGRMKYRV